MFKYPILWVQNWDEPVRGFAGELVVCGDCRALRGAGPAQPGARHTGRVRSQVGRGAPARENLRGITYKGDANHALTQFIQSTGKKSCWITPKKCDIQPHNVFPIYN